MTGLGTRLGTEMNMTVEKIGSGKRFTYAIGASLIAIGIAFVASALAAHWPVRVI